MLINQIKNQEQDRQTIGKHLITKMNLFTFLLVLYLLFFIESTNSNLLEQETEMVSV